MSVLKEVDADMEIRAYTEYNEAEILDLYASVGWTAYTDDPAALRNGFANSLLTLAAYEEATLAGLARVVGDGHTVVFVQDILVRPQFQRRGIGSALLQAVLNQYANVRQIELVTDDTLKTTAFYHSMGFQELTDLGCRGFMKI